MTHLQGTHVSGGGGSGSTGIELTDGTTDILGVAKITAALLAVGGNSVNATLTPNLTVQSSFTSGNVTGGNGGYTDLTSLSLAKGTWIVLGRCASSTSGFNDYLEMKIYNGSTIYGAGQVPILNGQPYGGYCFGVAVLSGTTTVSLAFAGGGVNHTINPSTLLGVTTASGLIAIKIA